MDGNPSRFKVLQCAVQKQLSMPTHFSQHYSVVYFDQLLGAARTQKLVETFYSAVIQPFLFISKLF